MHPNRRRTTGAVVTAATAALVATLIVGAPAHADTAADDDVTPAVPSVEEVTAEVSDDAHPVPAEVELVEFGQPAPTDAAATADDRTTGAQTFGLRSSTDDATAQDAPTAPEGTGEAGTAEPTEDPTAEPTEDPTEDPTAEQTEAAEGSVVAMADVPELAIVGVTWDAGAPEDLAVTFRTLTDDGWTDWDELEIDNKLADEDRTDREGTEPLAVTDASRIEVRLASSEGTAPTGANLAVVDPGTSTADTAPVTTAMTTTATSRPTIYTRAQWGADESIRTWAPQVGRVTGIDIHHTAGVNGYSSSQVPSIIRGIYSYHAEEWGRDWGDIGYNVLVDRFGRAWEGRYGGLDVAIIGAHATGLNGDMAGISLIGNYDTVAVPAPAFDMVARVAAWKMTIHGTTPHGTTVINGTTWNRVIGHRDAKQTTCPGRYMYSRLGELKDRIAQFQGSFAHRYLDRDLDGDGAADLVVRQGTRVSLLSSVPKPAWTVDRIGHGWNPDTTTIAGDWNGDGRPDLMLRTSSGDLLLYAGKADGSVTDGIRVGWGWAAFNMVVGGDDWNGDGHLDLLARKSDGTLWLYASDGSGDFRRGTRIGQGWNGMASISMAGDFAGGRPTILGTHATNGHLYAYTSNGRGTITGVVVVSSGWGAMGATAATSDFSGDGRPDLVSVDAGGVLRLYPGTGSGTVGRSQALTSGWAAAAMVVDVGTTARGHALYRLDSDGRLFHALYGANGPGYADLTDTGIELRASDLDVIAAGDWDGDGRSDLMVRRANGDLILHPGRGAGRFDPAGSRIGHGWQVFQNVVGAGNWRGDGRPGLVAYDRADRSLWLYPGNGSGGFASRIPVSRGAGAMDTVVNAGRWDGGGAPDIITRGGGLLFHYSGTGAGLMLPARTIGQGWTTMSSLVGVNDVTRDGAPDLIAHASTGTLLLYPGNGRGGFLPARAVGTLPTDARLS